MELIIIPKITSFKLPLKMNCISDENLSIRNSLIVIKISSNCNIFFETIENAVCRNSD